MIKIVLTSWLQASGKSTWAKEEVEENGAVRLNKDDIRKQLHWWIYSKSNEKVVVTYERAMVMKYMEDLHPYIIVDNTHLWNDNPHVAFYKSLAEDNGYEFSIKKFEQPLHVCIDRDAQRPVWERVGSKVIMDAYDKFVKNEKTEFIKRVQDSKLQEAYIFDIDWTLAIMNGRSPYDFSRVGEDSVNEDVKQMRDNLVSSGYDIIIVSGRDSSCRKETIKWLSDNGIYYNSLHMRQEWDKRSDDIVKRQIAEDSILPFYNIKWVFDDRNKVVKMWRELGLTCFQVAEWDF